jgi:hypothetical protein
MKDKEKDKYVAISPEVHRDFKAFAAYIDQTQVEINTKLVIREMLISGYPVRFNPLDYLSEEEISEIMSKKKQRIEVNSLNLVASA